MAEAVEPWSISRISVEFGMDRRTVTKRLSGRVVPVRHGRTNRYWVRDVAAVLFGPDDVDEDGEQILSVEESNRRRAHAETRLAELRLEKERGLLVDATDVAKQAFSAGAMEQAAWRAWATQAGPELAAALGADVARTTTELERLVTEQLRDRADNALTKTEAD